MKNQRDSVQIVPWLSALKSQWGFSIPLILLSGGHPRSEQTCNANSLAACAFSSRRDSTAVRPLGGLDSGNWHPHRLQAYPVSARADAAKRGLAISVVSSAIAFVGTSCDFNMYYRITR